jgi:Regulator of chromosome condensation (RCC1) repeat/PEGA domain
MRKATLLLAALALSAAPVAARAETTADARAEAKKHYDRAMELNEDGQVAQAVIELKRCYELQPHHTVLYNLGQAYITLAKPVEAVAALRRYLDEGGKAIKPDRRAEVEREIARQKTRIASLEIRGLPGGAVVRVDSAEVGTAPLGKPILVGIGDHVVSATAEGYDPAEVPVTVAGEDRRTVDLMLNCSHGYHNGGGGNCVATGVCSAGYFSDGRGTCVAVSCKPGQLLARAQSLLASERVSSGRIHTCGIRTDGSIACWGDKSWGAATPPAGTFTSISAGRHHTCGVNTKGTIACWGWGAGQAAPAAMVFSSVSAGSAYACGLGTDGTIACWGESSNGRATPPQGTFIAVSARNVHTCGLRTDGAVVCWGDNEYGQATPPTDLCFVAVSAGGLHTCGLRADGSVSCWGDNEYGQATPPTGAFTSVSAGGYHTCGVRNDRTVACWGSNRNGEATPRAGTFTSVSAGYDFTCGLRTDGTVTCWGNNTYGQATPPAM